MIPGVAPAIRKKSGGSGPLPPFTCTLTAGTFSGTAGYSDGSETAARGSIDQEPIPGNVLKYATTQVISTNNFTLILFAGDILSIVDGLSLYVDGNTDTTTWSVDVDGNTAGELPFGTDVAFVNGNAHSFEIK